ncbi:MAG: CDP-alcohol phosphatidyltransferase family protein [Clostridia bacterium]|nr:CDP-alcohol phosphatidyltransferase family protein [Oscillospiraceae bacterium]MBQ3524017.1 CDP-alcohol phosphatidyltransferase family protein [Clostridia bacterium]
MSEEKKTLKQNVKELFEGCLTIPNLISLIRICLIPVIAVLYYNNYIWWTVFVIFISGLSDAVDGKIARKFNQVSAIGKLLDPVADKLTIFALAIVLFLKFKEAQSESMQAFAWVFLLFIAKDIIMILGSVVLIALGTRPVAAEIWGKLATFVFYAVMVVIIGFGPEIGAISMYYPQYTIPETLMFVLVIIAVVLTFVAFFSYLPGAIKQIIENSKKKDK